ncbi:MAG: aldolase/citrate lyase family protein [Hyphomicrobiaceae bacterium]
MPVALPRACQYGRAHQGRTRCRRLGHHGADGQLGRGGEGRHRRGEISSARPARRRSWRASNYYLDEPAYMARSNDEVPLVLQIETKEAVAAMDEIAALPGIAALFVGPYDLCLSMGLEPGKIHPELVAIYQRLAAAAARNGLALAIDVPSLDYVKTYRQLGFSLMTHGLDMHSWSTAVGRSRNPSRPPSAKTERVAPSGVSGDGSIHAGHVVDTDRRPAAPQRADGVGLVPDLGAGAALDAAHRRCRLRLPRHRRGLDGASCGAPFR